LPAWWAAVLQIAGTYTMIPVQWQYLQLFFSMAR